MSDKLPWDIVIEILSRLPVRSLMRFKCVSRSFYDLISNDPKFKRKHLYQSSNSKRVILHPGYKTRGPLAFSCSLSSLSSGGPFSDDVIELELPLMVPTPLHRFSYYYNSCDGLFCIGHRLGVGVTIWNPSTREVQKHPSCFNADEGYYSPPQVSYWIAYDSVSDVYKVLGVVKYRVTIVVKVDFRVYSLKAGSSWREVEDDLPCGYISYLETSNFVNGAFHWLGYISVGIGPVCIVSLDMAEEKFRKFELPQAIRDSNKLKLCLLTGKLSVVWLWSEISCDIWVTKEYGVVESMTRTYSVSLAQLHKPLFFCFPLYMFEDNNTIIMYVAVMDGHEQIQTYKDGRFFCRTAVGNCEIGMAYLYSESLFSPLI